MRSVDKPKFDFYEFVSITRGKLKGKEAVVLGRTDVAPWRYAVGFGDECILYAQGSLKATGRKGKRSDFYSGKSIRVNEHGQIVNKTPASSSG